MARAKKAKSTREITNTVSDATADAAANLLRLAAEAGTGSSHSDSAETIARLARMCEEAADHMAQAQDVLFDGHEGGEAAITHLDAALTCLQALANEGERHISEKVAEAQTA